MTQACRAPEAPTAVLLAALVVSPAFSVSPPNGVLDWTFGRQGRVITDFSEIFEEAYVVTIQDDAKILVAGGAFFRPSGASFVLARYLPDGSLDPAFGDGGSVRTDFTAGSDVAHDLALQGDGKIVAAGFTRFGRDFAVARYHPDGSLDHGFGSAGRVVVDINGRADMAWAMAIQNDGRILICGKGGTKDRSSDFALIRLRRDGSLDESFGSEGIVTTDFFGDHDLALDLTLQPDGRIVVAGQASNRIAIARYDTNGQLDGSFGGGGLVTTELDGDAEALAVGLQPDGRIVLGGAVRLAPGETDLVLARYDQQGSFDPGFGGEGVVQTNVGTEEYITAIAIGQDGSILAAGLTELTAFDQGSQEFLLVRYTPTGHLDRTFGRRGVVTTDFSGDQDRANDLALAPDGGIVLVGGTTVSHAQASEDFDLALARYRYSPIFADGFESGDTTAWDQTKRRVAVVRPGMRGTGHALEVTVDGLRRKSFVRSRHPQRETTFRMDFRLLVNEVDLGGAKVEILRASGGRTVFQLLLEKDSGTYFVSLWAWEDSGSVRPVGRVQVPKRHGVKLAVEWCGATERGKRNGIARLLKKRRVKAQATDLDNAGLRVSDVKVGLPGGSRGTVGGSFLIDEYASIR